MPSMHKCLDGCMALKLIARSSIFSDVPCITIEERGLDCRQWVPKLSLCFSGVKHVILDGVFLWTKITLLI